MFLILSLFTYSVEIAFLWLSLFGFLTSNKNQVLNVYSAICQHTVINLLMSQIFHETGPGLSEKKFRGL